MKFRITLRTYAAMFLLATASGCATGYHPVRFDGGYEECRLQQGLYRIDFHGNRYTTKSTVRDFVLLRAAELTLQEGRSYFKAIEKESTYVDSVVGTDDWVTTLHRPNASLVIRCLDEKPEGDEIIYDAAQIYDNIRSTHRVVPPSVLVDEKRSTAKMESMVKAAVKESRLQNRPLLIRSLLTGQFTRQSPKDYAKKARAIAINPDLSDVEKLRSLAAISGDHANTTSNPQEKDAYTGLQEKFLKESQLLESNLACEEETTKPAKQVGDSEAKQVSFVEEVSD
jgi:hypothetical protein